MSYIPTIYASLKDLNHLAKTSELLDDNITFPDTQEGKAMDIIRRSYHKGIRFTLKKVDILIIRSDFSLENLAIRNKLEKLNIEFTEVH